MPSGYAETRSGEVSMARHATGGASAAAAALGIGVAAVSFHVLSPTAALVSCALGWAMLAIAAIDAQRFTIPDALSLPAIPAGLLASGYLLDPAGSLLVSPDHVIGAGVGGAVFWLVRETYFRWRGREGLGLGDAKLASAGGAWIGWEHLFGAVLLAATVALGLAAALAILRRESLSGADRIPFGTFLAPSIWIVWLVRASAQGL
jgi:leader peptidase (prepilin peptidase)/N-methyltransferase